MSRRAARSFASAAGEEKLERTALYNLHLELKGKMVPFAGYSLPVQYPSGVLTEHLHTRKEGGATLFDVGHMGQIKWHGKDRTAFLETLCVADLQSQKPHAANLTLLTLENGGILDDSIISNHGSYTYMVVNGATKFGDMKHFDAQLSSFKAKRGAAASDVAYEYLHTQNLVALQGPAASEILAGLVSAADAETVRTMPFMSGRVITVAGVPCTVTRCGYTGEDGYEVGMAEKDAEKVARAMLGDSRAIPAGLGARDSLRLEAGLCLYGHDIDDKITPNEGSLIWTIAKARRDAGRDNFLGAPVILKQLKEKSWAKRRVGLAVTGAPAREGARIMSSTDAATAKPVGVVTSGTFSPCLKAPIAMGYVETALMADGTQLAVEVRGKLQPATVAKMPFVPNRYYRGPGGK